MILQFITCAALILSSQGTSATDLTIKDIKTNDYINVNQSLHIQFTLGNINQLAASGYTYFVQVKDGKGNMLFMEEMQGPLIEAFTDQVITTSTEWLPLQTGNYTISAGVTFADDIDTTNNILSQGTTAILPRDEIVFALDGITSILPSCDSSSASGFIPLEPLRPGDFISHAESLGAFDIQSYTWFAYYDCAPEARFAHVNYFALVDAVDSTLQIFSSQYPPVINGQTYMTGIGVRDTTEDRILGLPQTFDTVLTASTIADETPAEPDPTLTCAILAGGKAYNNEEALAFRGDLENMERNLLRESLGLKLDSNQIAFIGNASSMEICDAIDNAQTGYDKILFYYAGHGNHVVNDTQRYGWLVTQDPGAQQLLHFTLAQKLKATSATDICVIIDACFSGEAIKDFRTVFGGASKDKNITVITAATDDTTSLSNRVFVTADGEQIWLGFFSWHFVLCYGEPMANSDDDPNISFPEAFHWVRKQNPETTTGKNIIDVMDPQLWLCRTKPVAPSPALTRFPDTDLAVRMNSEPSAIDSVSVSMEFYADSISSWEDESIISISPQRTWAMEWQSDNSYDMDLLIEYDPQFDHIPLTDSTEVGVVQIDENGSWRRVASQAIPDSNLVVATNLDTLGTYALATVKKTASSIPRPDLLDKINFAATPNPTAGPCQLTLNMAEGASVYLAVYDMTGKLMTALNDSYLGKGNHSFNIDMRRWPAGIFICTLSIGGQTISREVVKLD